MGNCQASEAATAVIQHPGGRVERLYWPTSAADVMKSNPGYYVALVTLYVSEEKQDGSGGTVRITRVRLLKPKDMLLLGQVYRLITSQEVTKALSQRKNEKLKKSQAELIRKQQQGQQQQQQQRRNDQGRDAVPQETQEVSEDAHQPLTKQERDQPKSSTQTATRGRHWRPSLGSISEVGS
ncbi:hypothetical protein OPV22_010913 [Ensete ventricosum]|uniref:Uncharacterized protein n=1 Tax=Ensete ventricosum TaxID=4639 RepID=A0AAV8RIF3_ENSVE|nr:hypothetical protein OPV22_010913 [Ensete ventricosum]